MFIERILLKGFKSFGGTHHLELAPGLTAIVGPNGSGKSNILDALKWVLGDSNPGRLRIQRQQDLIFQGSLTKPPAKFAEVSLVLKDKEASCDIKRRWSLSEGGSVFVDGEKIRLSDLDEVKRRWKLGIDRFAFIGQGEISEIIQQRPSQRREHFEALFGIDVYRKQREDALARLAEAKNELVRLQTLAAELRARKETIAPEVERALKAKDIMTRLAELKRKYYFIKKARAERVIFEVTEKLRALERTKGVVSLWPSLWAKALNHCDTLMDRLEGELRLLEEAVKEKHKTLEKMKKEMFGYGTTIKDFLGHEEDVLGELDKERHFLENLLKEKERADRNFILARERLLDKEKELKKLEEKKRILIDKIREQERKRSALLNKKENLEKNLELLHSELSKTGSIYWEFGKEYTETQGEIASLQNKIKELADEEKKARRNLDEALSCHSELFSRLQSVATRIQGLRKEITRTASLVEEMEDSIYAENYPKAVRHLLSASRLGKLDVELTVVAETMEGPTEILSAIEAFLGGRQYWVLVENLDAAGQCIDSLKASSAGRATFLPLEKVRPRRPSVGGIPEGIDGVISWACDLIRVDEKWDLAVRHLIGDLLIVRDYKVAKELSRRGLSCPIVSLEGDVINPSGTVVGGAKNRRTGAITSRANLLEKKQFLNKLKEEREKLQKKMEALEKEEHTWSMKKQDALRNVDLIKGALEEHRKKLARIAKRQGDIDDFKQKSLKKLKELGDRYLKALQELEKLNEILSSEEEEHLSIEKLAKEETQARVAVELEAEKCKAAQDILRRIEQEEERLRKNILSREEAARLAGQRRKTAFDKLKVLGEHYLSEWGSINEFKAKADKLHREVALWSKRAERIKNKKNMSDARYRQWTLTTEELRAKKASAEAELAELMDMWGDLEEEHRPIEEATENVENIRKKIRSLEKGLKDIGDVQMGVLSENDSLKERLDYLGDQLKDVNEGIVELEKLISRTDEHAGRAFKESLRHINGRFSDLFKRLFGGGEAQLRLEEGGGLWESGVEVIACPPGKRPQHIGQLSGGEQSLAAISLLFAAMEVAEVPIAVLDEVDAALDESNLRRFATLAEEYGQKIQLLCMTHRRVTMEHADVMYGVTLSEPGLSQIVGVRLEDWD